MIVVIHLPISPNIKDHSIHLLAEGKSTLLLDDMDKLFLEVDIVLLVA
jgi:hypothetical protein